MGVVHRTFTLRHRRTALVTLAIAVLAWPFPTIMPGIDGDWGWVAALAIATEQQLHFGSEIVWTYGPLGQVTIGTGALLYYSGTALAAFLFQWVVQLLLAATVFLAARRSYPEPAAFAVAFAVVALVPDRPVVLAFAWCALALLYGSSARDDWATRWFPLAIGVLTGTMLLGKVNHGIEVLVLAAMALSTRPGRRRRDAGIFAATALATAAAGWFATGQALGDVWDYARFSAEIARGYPAAMGIGQESGWIWAGAAVVFVLASALIWGASRRAGGSARWGLVALWLVYAYFAFKAGFVRGDHTAIFSGNVLMVLAVMPVPPPRRLLGLAAIAAGVIVFALSVSYIQLDRSLNPYSNAKALIDQAYTLANGERRTAARARFVSDVQAYYDFPPSLIDAIGDRSVTFWPRVFGDLSYAYGFDWRPLPVLQHLSHTPLLDELGADTLASRRAPEAIVRIAKPAIDGRFATFEAPATTRQIFCRYRELARAGEWQLLIHAADRCGSPRRISNVTADWGQLVEVPVPTRRGSAVFVRIQGANPAGLERIEALLLRPKIRYVHLDGQIYRLVAATAPDGLLMSAPPRADYPVPFAMAPNPTAIAVSRGDGQPGGKLTYTFFEQALVAPSRPGLDRTS